MILIDVPVKLVGAGIGDKAELATAGGAGVRLKPGDVAVELFDGIDWSVAHNGKSAGDTGARVALHRVAGREVIDVQAIDGDVILVDAGAGYGAGIGDARLQSKERDRVAPLLHRQVVKRLHVEGVADGGGGGVDGDFGVGSCHLNCLGLRTYLQSCILSADRSHVQVDVLDLKGENPGAVKVASYP